MPKPGYCFKRVPKVCKSTPNNVSISGLPIAFFLKRERKQITLHKADIRYINQNRPNICISLNSRPIDILLNFSLLHRLFLYIYITVCKAKID